MGRRKKIINNTGIPDYKIEALARAIMPDLIEYCRSEQGQREYAEYKLQKEYMENMKKTNMTA